MCRWMSYSAEAEFRGEQFFRSEDFHAVKELNPQIDRFSDNARTVVSEPFGSMLDS